MRHTRLSGNRWTQALVVALAIDVVLSFVSNIHEIRELLAGQVTPESLAALVGFAASVVIVVAGIVVGQALLRTRHELHRRTESLAADASLTADWRWESDAELCLTYCNGGVRTLLGYEPDDLIGRSMLTLLPEHQQAAAAVTLKIALDQHGGWDGRELTWLHADGSEVVLYGQAAPIKDERGALIGFRGTRRLVTPAEWAERSIEPARLRLRDLLDTGSVDVALQPIVDLGTGRLAGVEALARFHDGRSPDVWFGEAHDVGESLALDRLAFAKALALLPEIPAGCYLSANATPELVLSGQLGTDVIAADLPLDQLVIEITEHARIDDYDDVHQSLEPLRGRGARLAIDDTGAGFASLSHVLKLRPDIIKIDRSLITHVTSDPARRSLVTSLVLLAIDLGASITAEGIETPCELETLASLGADSGQGYLLGRPTTDRRMWEQWWERNWLAPVPSQPRKPAAEVGAA